MHHNNAKILIPKLSHKKWTAYDGSFALLKPHLLWPNWLQLSLNFLLAENENEAWVWVLEAREGVQIASSGCYLKDYQRVEVNRYSIHPKMYKLRLEHTWLQLWLRRCFLWGQITSHWHCQSKEKLAEVDADSPEPTPNCRWYGTWGCRKQHIAEGRHIKLLVRLSTLLIQSSLQDRGQVLRASQN